MELPRPGSIPKAPKYFLKGQMLNMDHKHYYYSYLWHIILCLPYTQCDTLQNITSRNYVVIQPHTIGVAPLPFTGLKNPN